MHQVLERYHQARRRTLDELLGLLDGGWRRGGFGDSDEERQLRAKADVALRRYYRAPRTRSPCEPVWFERAFTFRMGRAHAARARRPRRPPARTAATSSSTTRPAARDRRPRCARTCSSRSTRSARARRGGSRRRAQAYLYVLDDEKVRVPERRDRPRLDRRHRQRGRRRHPRPGLRADAVLRGLLDVRLPDRLPGRGALRGNRR